MHTTHVSGPLRKRGAEQMEDAVSVPDEPKPKIVQIIQAEHWRAADRTGGSRRVILWALLDTGEVVGMVMSENRMAVASDLDRFDGYYYDA